jgi:hypothetical protein
VACLATAMHTFARCTHFGDARGHAIDAAPHGGLGNVAVHWHVARSTAGVIRTKYPGCAALRGAPWVTKTKAGDGRHSNGSRNLDTFDGSDVFEAFLPPRTASAPSTVVLFFPENPPP